MDQRPEPKQVRNTYVEKEAFLEEIVLYQEACRAALAAGKPEPRIPDCIGHRLISIAEGIGSRYNFRNYTWVDEMILDGVEAAVRAVKKFDPNHEKRNPFGYFTRCIWWSFLSTMEVEKRTHKTKMDMMMDPNLLTFETMDGDEGDFTVGKDELLDFYYAGKDG